MQVAAWLSNQVYRSIVHKINDRFVQVILDYTIYSDSRREALEKWKQARGSEATYLNLIRVFQCAGYQEYAKTVKSTVAGTSAQH